MKYFTLILFFLFLFNSSFTQADLSSEEWRSDLRFLQNEINDDYPFLFKKVAKKDFDNAVEDLYEKIPNMESHEVVVGLAELIASFGYGHTALWLTAWRYNREKEFHQMPYNLYAFTDGIYVQGVHRDYKEAAGAKVLAVGKVPIDKALAQIRPVVSAENDQFFKAHGLNYLGVPEVLHAKGVIEDLSSVTLQLEKNGRKFDMTFTPRPSEEFPGYYGLIQNNEHWVDARQPDVTPLWLKQLEKKYFFEYLPETKIVYVRQSEVQDEEEENLEAFYGRVFHFIEENDVSKLILDLRLNSGGNNYKNKPVITGLIKSGKINQPGKLFVILGRRTFSACQNLVNEIENYTNAIFIGEPTAENVNFFGDSRKVNLPKSNLMVRLSYLWWQDKDPRDTRPWTPPHIAVDLSFADYRNNIDPVFNIIVETDQFEKPVEPWDHLANLFMSGKLEELELTAHKFVKDPTYKFYDFEKRINDAGYQLMSNDQFSEAIAVLGMNSRLFPDSPNVWDSLAEANWRNGNIQEAKQLYQKAIKLDPDGSIGENARSMLLKMEQED